MSVSVLSSFFSSLFSTHNTHILIHTHIHTHTFSLKENGVSSGGENSAASPIIHTHTHTFLGDVHG